MSLWHELHLLSKPQLILVNTTITAGVRKFLAYLVRVYMHFLVCFYKLKECGGVPIDKYRLCSKHCFSVATLDVVYSVVNDCIELGIHGAFNRMIKALIESPSSKEEVVISSFIKMSSFENISHKQMIKKVVGVHLPQLDEDRADPGSFETDSADELMVPSTQIYEAFK